jgi:hypothetical protein
MNANLTPAGDDELDKFLATLNVHNKDLVYCFSDAVAVQHLKQLIARLMTEARIDALKQYSRQCGILRMEPSTADLKRHIRNLEAELQNGASE